MDSYLVVEQQTNFLPLQSCWVEFAQPVYMCFVDLENAYNCVPWGVQWEYGAPGLLLLAIWSPDLFVINSWRGSQGIARWSLQMTWFGWLLQSVTK